MIDLVTVVYGEEIPFLKTQAQSIDLYAKDIDKIRVVINDDKDHDIDVSWWGKYHDRVTVTRYSDHGIKPMNLGWDQQQISKLMAAKESAGCAVILDAKTWIVKEFGRDDFFHDDGKIAIEFLPVPDIFSPGYDWICDFFGIESAGKMLGPLGVPFVMESSVLKELDRYLIDRTGQPLQLFLYENMRNISDPEKIFVTEFGLYSAFVIFKQYQDRYRKWQKFELVNIAAYEAHMFEELFMRMQRPEILTVSIHRDARKKLTQDQSLRWKNWLQSRGLNIHT